MLKGAIELWVVFDIGEAQIIAGQALQDSAEIWQVWFPVQLQVGSTSGHCMQPAPPVDDGNRRLEVCVVLEMSVTNVACAAVDEMNESMKNKRP